MPYCKHCHEYIFSWSEEKHECPKEGLLGVSKGDSFLVSTLIGAATDSALLGGLLGGDILGGLFGDSLDGDLLD